MRKRLTAALVRFMFWRRLSLVEAHAQAVKEIFVVLGTCIDCGAVMNINHAKVGLVKLAEGKQEIRCKWDHREYERSQLASQRHNEQKRANREAAIH